MISGTTQLERAKLALNDSPIRSVRGLIVQQAGDSIIISGRVESFYYKQMAQEAIRSVCRGIELVNDVAVSQ